MKPKDKLVSTFFNNNLIKNLLSDDHPLVQLKKQIDWNKIRNQLMTDANGEPVEYSSTGRPAWDPLIIFKMLILQIWNPVSDRNIEERASTDLAYRYFLDIQFPKPVPDETTLSRYRTKWGENKIRELNIAIIKQIQEKGLAKIREGIVGDTTHQHAPIQKPTARQLIMDCLQKFIKELEEFQKKFPSFQFEKQFHALINSYRLWHSQYVDLIKEKKLSKSQRLSELVFFILDVQAIIEPLLPEFKRQYSDTPNGKTVLSIYDLLKELLEQNVTIDTENGERIVRQKKKGRKIISLRDIDARPGQKNKNKKFIGYKVATTRTKDGYIIDVKTIPGDRNDMTVAKDMIDAVLQDYQEIPETVGLDKGFSSIENRAYMHAYGIQPGIEFKEPSNPKNPEKFNNEKFSIDLEVMTATCPAGQTSSSSTSLKNPERYQFKFSKDLCNTCELREQCTSSKTGRTIQISQYQELLEQDKAFLATQSYKEVRTARWGQEGDYAWAKKTHGLDKSRYLGLERTGVFNRVVFIVQNLKRFLKQLKRGMQRPIERRSKGRASVS